MARRGALALALALALARAAGAAGPAVPIGWCTDELEEAKAAGFDYAELGVRRFASLSPEAFEAFRQRHRQVGLPTPVGNLFLPAELKVVGPAVDHRRLDDYVRTAFTRARQLGLETIVFGSGPARHVPEGFPREEAFRQLVGFARRIAPEAGRHGLVLAVEAQRRQETNIINNTAEAVAWVRAVGHPRFRVMVDLYHLALEGEDPAVLRQVGPIAHVHVANPEGRAFPRRAGEYDYARFFENLRRAGYRGRISVEARTQDLRADAAAAITLLRAAAAPR